MTVIGRAIRGSEAGVIAAAGVAVSFLVFDVLRLEPLATPGALADVTLGPDGLSIDFTSVSGVVAFVAAAANLVGFTIIHFVAFAGIGVAASLLFDWGVPGGVPRALSVVALCTVALYGTVATASSLDTLDTIGWRTSGAIVLIGAMLLAGVLRFAAMHSTEDSIG